MNPGVDPTIIAEAYERDASAAAAEYGAEFRPDRQQYVERAVIVGLVVEGRHELPPVVGVKYTAFADPSGGSSDSMTIAIAHKDGDNVVLDAVREIRPPFSPDDCVAEFAGLLKAYKINEVHGDRYGGSWPAERFKARGIKYIAAEKPKSDLYRDLLPILNSGRAELLDVPRLVSQLCGLERRTARGGRDSIDHPPGGHDDVANAVAGAINMVGKGRQAVIVTPEQLAAIQNYRGPGYRPQHGARMPNFAMRDRPPQAPPHVRAQAAANEANDTPAAWFRHLPGAFQQNN
jgi:hypothetical protein